MWKCSAALLLVASCLAGDHPPPPAPAPPDLNGWYSVDVYMSTHPLPVSAFLQWRPSDGPGEYLCATAGTAGSNDGNGTDCYDGPAKFSVGNANGWTGIWPQAAWQYGPHPPEGVCNLSYAVDTAVLTGSTLVIEHQTTTDSVGGAETTCTRDLALQYLGSGAGAVYDHTHIEATRL